jgi:hypothetical protein
MGFSFKKSFIVGWGDCAPLRGRLLSELLPLVRSVSLGLVRRRGIAHLGA